MEKCGFSDTGMPNRCSQLVGGDIAPAKPVVAKGDKVKVGTLIAEAGGFVSAPIYSSVSGTVFKVDKIGRAHV